MINITALTYSFNQHEVLKDINLEFDNTEFVGLIGANGSGKTTLLKCISGLYPTISQISVDNKYVEKFTVQERAAKIAMMHQGENVNFDFLCYDVVALGRYIYNNGYFGVSEDSRQVIDDVMQKTKTTKFKKRLITQLSGGEKQRVLFAKALVQEGNYLLLDEPTSTLDIKYQHQIYEVLKQISREGVGVVSSIHNIQHAIKYCDRLVLLAEGKVIADGAAADVITSENIKKAYDVDVEVYYSEKHGHIDFVLL